MTGLLFVLGAGMTPRAADWPQFLGPNRNGSTPDPIGIRWGGDGPRQRWRIEVGAGFAGPVVSRGTAVLFHRIGDDDVLLAVDAISGKQQWERRQPSAFVDSMGSGDGPRSTPCISGGRIYTFGADGRLACFNLSDGASRWSIDTQQQYQSDPGFFGFGCSPLVVSNRVLLNLGGKSGAGLAAFDSDTGKLIWKLKDQEAGYASPVLASDAEMPLALFFNREGLVGVGLSAGTERFSFPWRSRMSASVNAASPVVSGNDVFLTSSYGAGAVLLRRTGGQLKIVWSGDESLSAHFETPVLRSGFLYGFHGRQERGAELRCVEWDTGRVRWSQEGLGAGTVALSGDRLVVLLESGEMLVVRASPDAFAVLARAQILGRVARAPLALADGALFARDSRQWVCVDLKPKAGDPEP